MIGKLEKFESKTPIFTKGRMLKNEMLESLRDFPRDVTAILYVNHVDGVIAGLDLTVDDTHITISKGIVKYKEELLVLGEILQIPYEKRKETLWQQSFYSVLYDIKF